MKWLGITLWLGQWFGEGHRIVEALLEERRLENCGPVCRPAQVDLAVHRLRSLQRHVRSLLGSLSTYTAVQQKQRQVTPLPRSFRKRRNTRRRWKACRNNVCNFIIDSYRFKSLFFCFQTCSKCQTRRKCTKKFTIHKFPQILVLRKFSFIWSRIQFGLTNCLPTDLKRFSPGERFRKLDASVDFPLTDLDMSAYTSPGIKPSPCSYQLYGVINHSGSAYSGHYTASCRHPFSAAWHEYNDSR